MPTIRPATPADVPALLDMMMDFNRGEGVAWTPARGEAPLRRLLGDPTLGAVGVAEESERATARPQATLERGAAERPGAPRGRERAGNNDGAAVGYFVVTWGYDLEWDGRDAFLTEIYLVPSARGRGDGRALLAAVEQTALAAGARALHLMVRHENAPAIALYDGAGYSTPARRFMSKVLGED